LHAGRLFAAGLDVFEREPEVEARLLSAPRTVLLPHIGSASVDTRRRMAQMATGAVATVLDGGSPSNSVEA
jgi:lactate dehydrogenase-like 2-hydroxyacid dehydrogenase